MNNINIRKKFRYGLINESIYQLDNDVNLLYNSFFKKDIDKINETSMLVSNMFEKHITSTNILTDEKSLIANNLNPCEIFINYGINAYNPNESKIYITVNFEALNFIIDNMNDLNKSYNNLPKNQKKSFINEFKEHKIKGSINHELIHWIDDTINNKHIKNTINLANEKGIDKIFKSKDINTSKMEIQGQIGNIIQLKNKFNDNWNEFSFIDMINLSPSLRAIYNSLNHSDKYKWIRNLKTRMYREKLLGNNMIN